MNTVPVGDPTRILRQQISRRPTFGGDSRCVLGCNQLDANCRTMILRIAKIFIRRSESLRAYFAISLREKWRLAAHRSSGWWPNVVKVRHSVATQLASHGFTTSTPVLRNSIAFRVTTARS